MLILLRTALAVYNIPNPSAPPASPIPFLHLIERLKTTPREGWRRLGIVEPESIADHMYRMSIMAMLCPQALRARGLNVERAVRMALVHDMAESLVGDITPVDGVDKVEKSRRESDTINYLTQRLLGLELGSAHRGRIDTGMFTGAQEMMELWQEYEDSITLEAKFVHDVDKIELVLQMMEYERRGKGNVDLGEFVWVTDKITLLEMRAWAADVMREREEFWKRHEKEPTNTDLGRKLIEKVEEERSRAGT